MNRLLHNEYVPNQTIMPVSLDIVKIPPGFLFFRGIKIKTENLIFPINHKRNPYKDEQVFLGNLDVAILYACNAFLRLKLPQWKQNKDEDIRSMFNEFRRSNIISVICYTNTSELNLSSINSHNNYKILKNSISSYKNICEPSDYGIYTLERGENNIDYTLQLPQINNNKQDDIDKYINNMVSNTEMIINKAKRELTPYFICNNENQTKLNTSCSFCKIISTGYSNDKDIYPPSYGILKFNKDLLSYLIRPTESREEPPPIERMLIFGADHSFPTMNDFKLKSNLPENAFPKKNERGAGLYYKSCSGNNMNLIKLLDGADYMVKKYITKKHNNKVFSKITSNDTQTIFDLEDAALGNKYCLWVHLLQNSVPHLHIHVLIISESLNDESKSKLFERFRELFESNIGKYKYLDDNGNEASLPYCMSLDNYRNFCWGDELNRLRTSNKLYKDADYDYKHYTINEKDRERISKISENIRTYINNSNLDILLNFRKEYYKNFTYKEEMNHVIFKRKSLSPQKAMIRLSRNNFDKDAVKSLTQKYNTLDGMIGFKMKLAQNNLFKKQHEEIILSNPSKLIEVPNHPFCIPSSDSKIEPYLFALYIQLKNSLTLKAGIKNTNPSLINNQLLVFNGLKRKNSGINNTKPKLPKFDNEDNKDNDFNNFAKVILPIGDTPEPRIENDLNTKIEDILELDFIDILGHTSSLSHNLKLNSFDDLYNNFLSISGIDNDSIGNETLDLMKQIYKVAIDQNCDYSC